MRTPSVNGSSAACTKRSTPWRRSWSRMTSYGPWTERLRRGLGVKAARCADWEHSSGGRRRSPAEEQPKEITMSPLRMRMLEDMKLAGLAEGTRAAYLRAVRQLAKDYRRAPGPPGGGGGPGHRPGPPPAGGGRGALPDAPP